MRYKLSDDEWAGIKPMPPNKPRGAPQANDRRVFSCIFVPNFGIIEEYP